MLVKRAGFEFGEWPSVEFDWFRRFTGGSLPASRQASMLWETFAWGVNKRKSMFTQSPRFVVQVSVERRP